MKKIAILGFGVVGSGVAEVLEENKKLIASRVGDAIEIKYILDLREFPDSPFGKLVVHDFDVILSDPEVTLVAEMMGGSHPAYDFSVKAIKAGKSVVTSNKEVVANFGTELLKLAAENGVSYMFEASVGGGIPIIRPMINDLASNRILSVNGILNGTTNYILTQMELCDTPFADALKDAQKKGYAEADPTADIEGLDAARKIVILAALAYGVLMKPACVKTEGITNVTVEDIRTAKKNGYAVKLIGTAEQIDGKVFAMVSPRMVPLSSPIAGVGDVFNGILVDTDMLGKAMFYGRGAGKLPTASAVCADIIDILSHDFASRRAPVFTDATAENIASIEAYSCMNVFVKDGTMTAPALMTEAEALRTAEQTGAKRYRVL